MFGLWLPYKVKWFFDTEDDELIMAVVSCDKDSYIKGLLEK
jgi:hypothetical protein